MKGISFLFCIAILYPSLSFAQEFISREGSTDWDDVHTWGGSSVPAAPNTVSIQSRVRKQGSLTFTGPNNRLTVGEELENFNRASIASYDILTIDGDLNMEKGNASKSNGFTIHENGIMVVFGDVIWNKNKAFINNSGMLVITGNLIGKGSANHNVYKNNELGLLFMTGDEDGNFSINNFTAPSAELLAIVPGPLDIDRDLCDPTFLAEDPRRLILDDLCAFVSNLGSSPLPVELLSFSGVVVEDGVKLYWETSSEENNDYFTLQRSTDGINYDDIGKIVGHGTIKVAQEYIFKDDAPMVGPAYYRLLQTDYDGSLSVFDPILITFTSTESAITIYPNPIRDQALNLRVRGLSKDQEARINITDLAGRSLHQALFNVGQASSEGVELDIVSSLRPGTYIAHIDQNGRVYQKMFVKR